MKQEITSERWERYQAELNDLDEKYQKDRDAIRERLMAEQKALRIGEVQGKS